MQEASSKELPQVYKNNSKIQKHLLDAWQQNPHKKFFFPRSLDEITKEVAEGVERIIPAMDDGADVRLSYTLRHGIIQSWIEQPAPVAVELYAECPLEQDIYDMVRAVLKKTGDILSDS